MPDFGIPYDLANNRPFKINRNNFYGVLDRDFRKTYADIYTAPRGLGRGGRAEPQHPVPLRPDA